MQQSVNRVHVALMLSYVMVLKVIVKTPRSTCSAILGVIEDDCVRKARRCTL